MDKKINYDIWKIGKAFLTTTQSDVLFKNKTETPRQNQYWNFSEPGLYVDPVNGEILFSSFDKYFSQCGWPAFLKPYNEANIRYLEDFSHNMHRIEIRSQKSELHLGHVFEDLEQQLLDKGYRRFCINSAALKFLSATAIINSNEEFYQRAWIQEVAKNEAFYQELYLAGGCFWGIDLLLKQIPGVLTTTAGYANSIVVNPTYQQVCTSKTKATETVKVTFNLKYLSFAKLLAIFFANINPQQVNGQANDIGTQYRSGIYYVSQSAKKEIETLITNIYKPKFPKLATEILPLENFYPAESNHQDYLIKNPNGYCHITFKNLH